MRAAQGLVRKRRGKRCGGLPRRERERLHAFAGAIGRVGGNPPPRGLLEGTHLRTTQPAQAAGARGESGMGAQLLGERPARRRSHRHGGPESRPVAPDREPGGKSKCEDRGRRQTPQQMQQRLGGFRVHDPQQVARLKRGERNEQARVITPQQTLIVINEFTIDDRERAAADRDAQRMEAVGCTQRPDRFPRTRILECPAHFAFAQGLAAVDAVDLDGIERTVRRTRGARRPGNRGDRPRRRRLLRQAHGCPGPQGLGGVQGARRHEQTPTGLDPVLERPQAFGRRGSGRRKAVDQDSVRRRQFLQGGNLAGLHTETLRKPLEAVVRVFRGRAARRRELVGLVPIGVPRDPDADAGQHREHDAGEQAAPGHGGAPPSASSKRSQSRTIPSAVAAGSVLPSPA